MRRRALAVWLVAGALALAGPARAADPRDPNEAAALLSRYPAGSLPLDPTTMTAIHLLGEAGDRQDISLLRNIAEHERDEIRAAAVDAIGAIRDRQRIAQRERFARDLPDQADLAAPAAALRAQGLGGEEAACAAYADRILGTEPLGPHPSTREEVKGDPEALIEEGRPRTAVAVLERDPSSAARALEARAWEDLGEPRGAVRQYALLAARGEAEGWEALDRFGVDPERLLLGLLTHADTRLPPGAESEVLEVLVRRGELPTVEVLAERATHRSASERAIATDALVRMIQAAGREHPLGERAHAVAHEALVRATRDRVESIRAIALEAL
jgi:HEAT repeat protein